METRGLFKQAIENYEKAITLDLEDAQTIFELGVAYLAQGQKYKAMALYPTLNRSGVWGGIAKVKHMTVHYILE